MNTELFDKKFWVRQFRKAKKLSTLHLMVSRAIDRYHTQTKILAAIYLAECQRNRELEMAQLLDR